MRQKRDGPAVMLCEPSSVFPAHLAAYWRATGMDVVLVTHRQDAQSSLPDGTPIVRSSEHESKWSRRIRRRLMNPLLYRLERTVPRFKQRFTRITGAPADSELRMPFFAEFVASAWPTAQAAQALRPEALSMRRTISIATNRQSPMSAVMGMAPWRSNKSLMPAAISEGAIGLSSACKPRG